MSTRARKERKRAGIKFEAKPQKVGTPVEERSFVTALVHRSAGDAIPAGFTSLLAPRSPKRIARFIANGGRLRPNSKDAS